MAAPLVFLAAAVCVIRLLSARADLVAARAALTAAKQATLEHRTQAASHDLDTARRRLLAARRVARSLPLGPLRAVPLVGSPTRAVSDASRAGLDVVAAGRVVVAAAESFPTSGRRGVDGHDLSTLHAAAERSIGALAQADRRLAAAASALHGPASAFLPPVSSQGRAMRRVVADARRQLDGARRGITLLDDLSAPTADARLLLLSQDSLELRPTGGFIGSFGVLHFHHGTVALERYDSFESLPPPDPPMNPPERLAVALGRPWDLSNSNWWPDFPTTARTAREMFRRQGGGDVDGVLAITQATTARLVGVFGGVTVPGYDKPVTQAGFDQRVLYEVEQKRPPDQPRKKFLTLLSHQVFDRLLQLDAARVPAVARALGASVDSGDLQLWFADPGREGLLAGTAWAGALPAPTRSDFLLLVDANLSASKANAGLTRSVVYRVRRNKGVYVAHLEARYADSAPRDPDRNPYYNGYLRVYAPLGSRLVDPPDGVEDMGAAPDGRYEVFAQGVYVEPGSTAVVSFDYRLPPSVAPGGHYRLAWLRQPGTASDSLTAEIGGAVVSADPEHRELQVAHTLAPNRVRDFLRGRWVIRELGLG